MEFEQAVRRRRMVRSFTSEPVEPGMVDEICDLARRAPTAGNTAGIEFLVLEGSDTAAYWDVTLPRSGATASSGPACWLPDPGRGLVPIVAGYLSRYGEPDKRHTGLGASPRRPGRCPTGSSTAGRR